MSAIKFNGPNDLIKRKVKLVGMSDLMFDRYAGDNSTKLEVWQKFYFSQIKDRGLVLPALNLHALLSAQNTNSAPKRLRDKRKYKDIANACLSFVQVGPKEIPILRNGKQIIFGRFDQNDRCETSNTYVHRSVARLKDGIPNPKVRPVICLPWEIEFDLTILPNREIKEQEIANLIEEAGYAIGLGTYRGVFGKYSIASWE